MSWLKRRKKSSMKTGDSPRTRLPSDELDQKLKELMEQLNIPFAGRAAILKLTPEIKGKMLESYKERLKSEQTSKKRKATGKEWAKRLILHPKMKLDLLKEFTVVLNDSDAKFAQKFMEELGLNHLCRISMEKQGQKQWDFQILTIVKALIDTAPQVIQTVIKHERIISVIVTKIDTDDMRVREIAIKLLFLTVVIEGESAHMASLKIMEGLLEQARFHGFRNRWRSIVRHISSVNEYENGSFEYDNYALALINYVINELHELEQRTDERRLLNSLKFDSILDKLRISIENKTREIETGIESMITDENESNVHHGRGGNASKDVRQLMVNLKGLENQLKVYETLRIDDRQQLFSQGLMDDERDLTSPKGLFNQLHTQVLEDGYVNEFTAILKNLITLPASAFGLSFVFTVCLIHI